MSGLEIKKMLDKKELVEKYRKFCDDHGFKLNSIEGALLFGIQESFNLVMKKSLSNKDK